MLLAALLLCIPVVAQTQKKPVIGISCSIDGTTVEVGMTYVKSVRKAGGIPFIIPITTNEKEIDEYLDRIDGLLMTGGEDVGALLFGEEPSRFLGEVVPDRDIYDLTLIRKAVKRGIPVFGICRGIQCLNIAMGGDMIQDIPSEVPDAIQHRQNAPVVPQDGDTVPLGLGHPGLPKQVVQTLAAVAALGMQPVSRSAAGAVQCTTYILTFEEISFE